VLGTASSGKAPLTAEFLARAIEVGWSAALRIMSGEGRHRKSHRNPEPGTNVELRGGGIGKTVQTPEPAR
jgi:hypothetical protein